MLDAAGGGSWARRAGASEGMGMRSRGTDVLAAASMYYLQDMKMEAIAKHLGTSRSTVSRLIRDAHATGLVEITVRPAASQAPDLSARIREQFGIEAYVVPVPQDGAQVDRLSHVARTAGRLLTSWFDSQMVLAVAWGTTISAVARHLSGKPTTGSAVVQLNGAASTRSSGVDYAGELMVRFAEAYGAASHYFPVPAFFDYAATKEAMWRERSVKRVIDVQRRADIALFSVGALEGELPSHVYSAGFLDAADVRMLEAAGVVGDVCTVFLRGDGSFVDIEINARATGPTPDQLRAIPRRVCVVAGENKVVPLRAALLAGAATHVVIDELSAARLVAVTDDGEPPAAAP